MSNVQTRAYKYQSRFAQTSTVQATMTILCTEARRRRKRFHKKYTHNILFKLFFSSPLVLSQLSHVDVLLPRDDPSALPPRLPAGEGPARLGPQAVPGAGAAHRGTDDLNLVTGAFAHLLHNIKVQSHTTTPWWRRLRRPRSPWCPCRTCGGA